jgi:hypothetical protein
MLLTTLPARSVLAKAARHAINEFKFRTVTVLKTHCFLLDQAAMMKSTRTVMTLLDCICLLVYLPLSLSER